MSYTVKLDTRSLRLIVEAPTAEKLIFALKPVTANEIKDFREWKFVSFILKIEGQLYHTTIPKELSVFTSNLLCAVPILISVICKDGIHIT